MSKSTTPHTDHQPQAVELTRRQAVDIVELYRRGDAYIASAFGAPQLTDEDRRALAAL